MSGENCTHLYKFQTDAINGTRKNDIFVKSRKLHILNLKTYH